jgi:hypothetical protein
LPVRGVQQKPDAGTYPDDVDPDDDGQSDEDDDFCDDENACEDDKEKICSPRGVCVECVTPGDCGEDRLCDENGDCRSVDD